MNNKRGKDQTTLEDQVETIQRLLAEMGRWKQPAVDFGNAIARYAAHYSTFDFMKRQVYLDHAAKHLMSKNSLAVFFTPLTAVPDRKGTRLT